MTMMMTMTATMMMTMTIRWGRWQWRRRWWVSLAYAQYACNKSDRTDIDAVSNIAHTHVTPACDLLHERQAGWPTPPVLKQSCGIQSFVKTCQNIFWSLQFSEIFCFNVRFSCDSHISNFTHSNHSSLFLRELGTFGLSLWVSCPCTEDFGQNARMDHPRLNIRKPPSWNTPSVDRLDSDVCRSSKI